MPAPAVSVLVPIFNTERYLRQALDSLRAQTLQDIEVVCINDGSTDGSRAIIQEYLDLDPRFRVIDKPNSGYGASMNRGISEATGEYVGVLEPDDFLEPHALELLWSLASSADADIAKANHWFYWSTPEEKNKLIQVVRPEMAGHAFRPEDEPAILHAIPSIWTGIYRRTFLEDAGIRLSETPGASFQDTGFSFKAYASASRVICSEEPILHYRQDNEASSVNNPNKVFCVCDEFDSIWAFLDDRTALSWARGAAYRLMYDSYVWNFERLSPELRRSFMPRMHADLADHFEADADLSLFGSWQSANLRRLLVSPEHMLEHYPTTPSRLSKAVYYLGVAGPRGVIDAFRR